MFNYLMKNLPSKFVYAGYNVRKSITIMTSVLEEKVIYDIFSFTYVDNYLSFYLLMDDGKYKCVSEKVNVDSVDAENLASRHLFRGETYDTTQYTQCDKDQIVGVFGLRPFSELIVQADEMEKANGSNEMSMQALLDTKASYNGLEITGVINRFNKNLNWVKGIITIPPITYGEGDSYVSAIGDEVDYFDFMSNKTSDEVIRALKVLVDTLDGVGNKK